MNKSSNESKETKKPMNTILQYFKRPSHYIPPIKVMCPGCNSMVIENKLNFHLDSECKSRNAAKSNRKNKSKLARNKTKPQTSKWSDNEDDFGDEPLEHFLTHDAKDHSCEELDSEIYFNSSMLETQLDEDDVDNVTVRHLISDWDSPEKENTNIDVKSSPEDVKDSKKIILDKFLSSSNSDNSTNTVFNGQDHILPSKEFSPPKRTSKIISSHSPYSNYSNSTEYYSPGNSSKSSPKTPTRKLITNNMDNDADDFEEGIIFRTPTNTPKTKRRSSSKSPPNNNTGCKKSLFNENIETVHLSPSLKRNLSSFSHSQEIKEKVNSKENETENFNNNRYIERAARKAIQNTTLLNNSPIKFQRKSSFDSPTKYNGNSPVKFNDDSKARFRGVKGMYLDNFLLILETVFESDSNTVLFNNEDINTVKAFQLLSLEAQKLYVRLFQRKIKWNRSEKIDYQDICEKVDIPLYLKELYYAGFLINEEVLEDLTEILNLLNHDEIKKLCKDLNITNSGKKEDLIKGLIKHSQSQRSVLHAFKTLKKSGETSIVLRRSKDFLNNCYIIEKEKRQVFMRIIMLYSLPVYDDDEDGGSQARLTTLLMVGLGKIKFPNYNVIRNHKIFRSRDDLIRFETSSQLENEIRDLMESHNWVEAEKLSDLAVTTYEELLKNEELLSHDFSLPPFLRRFTPMSILVYIMSNRVEVFQKLRNYQAAVDQLEVLIKQTIYLQDYRGRWYDRLALNLQQHLKNPLKAIKAIHKALEDPEVRVGHRLALSLRAQNMLTAARYKKYIEEIEKIPILVPSETPKVVIDGKCLPSDIPGQKRVFLIDDPDSFGESVTCCSVEELVLAHYKMKGYPQGLHKEGITVNSLFGLLFWDCIYADIEDAFHSNHQATPLDLDCSSFYKSRKEIIDLRLEEIESKWTSDDAESYIRAIWNEYCGTSCLVNWDIFKSIEYIKGLIEGLGLSVVAAICKRLAMDHRFTRSGFPDLIVWNPQTKKSKVVEVKGPNDRLSTKQILWIDYLNKNGAEAEVCHVQEIGAKRIMKTNSQRKYQVSPVKSKKKEVDSGTNGESPRKKKAATKRKISKSPNGSKRKRKE